MPRNLKIHNSQRLQTGQLAASVPIVTPGAVRPLHSLNTPKRGVMTKPGVAVAQPTQGRLSNTFNANTDGNGNLGDGFEIQYPVARVIPAMRNRMEGTTGHPVITKIAKPLQK